jgi:TRAP-type mannitol/chloroaromatic compound transport system permease large subunit
MVPLLAPVAQKLGIDLIWFGIMLGVNMQTSFMHPPFGFSLFYLRSVAPPSIRTTQIYWGAIPFVIIQLVMVAAIIAFPDLVTRDARSTPTDMKENLEQIPLPELSTPDPSFDSPASK